MMADPPHLLLAQKRANATSPRAGTLPQSLGLRALKNSAGFAFFGFLPFILTGANPPTVPKETQTLSRDAFAQKSLIDVRVGRNKTSGRVEIYGSVGSKSSVRKLDEDGREKIVVRFSGAQKPDIGDIRANMPIGVDQIDFKAQVRFSELSFLLKPDYKARFGREDGGVFLQFDAKDPHAHTDPKNFAVDVAKEEIAKTEPLIDQKIDALNGPIAPSQDALKVDVANLEAGRVFSFQFDKPVAAAVFRRGEAIWVVFETNRALTLPPQAKDGKIVTQIGTAQSDGFSALRITAPSAGAISVQSQGVLWRIGIGTAALTQKSTPIGFDTDRSGGLGRLQANVPGLSRIAYILDPTVGDRLAVVTALGPVKRVVDQRYTVDAHILPSFHGVAVERMASDLKLSVVNDELSLDRPGGLYLSGPNQNQPNAPTVDPLSYAKAAYPTAMEQSWSVPPIDGFLARYQALQSAAANEIKDGSSAPITQRLHLARFLIGQGMALEAQGLLDMTLKRVPKALDDPQARGLRALAKLMAGREAEALTDLTAPALSSDPLARLWQAYVQAKQLQNKEALSLYERGMGAMSALPPDWRSKILSEIAHAALRDGQLDKAESLGWLAAKQPSSPLDQLKAYLVLAKIFEEKGEKERALGVFSAVARASRGDISVPAQMHAVKLNYELKRQSAEKTLVEMDALRFQWRGDASELDIITAMGEIYLTLGRYRDALQILKSAGASFKNRPETAEIYRLLSETFRNLFLNGLADGLQPIESLALFNDFRELTPLGREGDDMVRRIVKRLVGVDLLDQAAELLDYQVGNRLEGPAKSAVAADLAAIHLMNRDPQKALQALWNTRTTLLPKNILADRRLIEARALLELDQADKALDILGGDVSQSAELVRADILMRKADYARAGLILEKILGNRFRDSKPLSAAEESVLIRTGIAFSLAKDAKALERLTQRYLPYASTASQADAVRVALAPLDGGDLSVKDIGQGSDSLSSFTSWVEGMKKRFREQPDPKPVQTAEQPRPQTPPSPLPS